MINSILTTRIKYHTLYFYNFYGDALMDLTDDLQKLKTKSQQMVHKGNLVVQIRKANKTQPHT